MQTHTHTHTHIHIRTFSHTHIHTLTSTHTCVQQTYINIHALASSLTIIGTQKQNVCPRISKQASHIMTVHLAELEYLLVTGVHGRQSNISRGNLLICMCVCVCVCPFLCAGMYVWVNVCVCVRVCVCTLVCELAILLVACSMVPSFHRGKSDNDSVNWLIVVSWQSRDCYTLPVVLTWWCVVRYFARIGKF